MRLAGQVALVTGAGRGIGAACARGLAAHGAHVVVADVDRPGAEAVASDITEAGGRSTAVSVDMADVASVRTMVDVAVEWGGGRLDVLMNNAGIGIAKPLLDYTPEDWQRQMAVNVHGPFFALQAAASVMMPAGRGKVVNVVSTSGFVSSSTPAIAYDVSKGAMRQLTISAAAELAPYGVNVNGIAPGTVATDLTMAVLDTPEKMARAAGKIPLGRLAAPDDMVGAVVFLASGESDYVCGHVLVVDGGWLVL